MRRFGRRGVTSGEGRYCLPGLSHQSLVVFRITKSHRVLKVVHYLQIFRISLFSVEMIVWFSFHKPSASSHLFPLLNILALFCVKTWDNDIHGYHSHRLGFLYDIFLAMPYRRPRNPTLHPLTYQQVLRPLLILPLRPNRSINREPTSLQRLNQLQQYDPCRDSVCPRRIPRHVCKMHLDAVRCDFTTSYVTTKCLEDCICEVFGWWVYDFQFITVVEGYADPVAGRWDGILFSKDEGIWYVSQVHRRVRESYLCSQTWAWSP